MRFSKYVILAERCKYCEACLEICPDNAIIRTENGVCAINQDLCTYCGKCMDVCQVQAIKKKICVSVLFK